MADKKGFRTVESEIEEMNEQIRSHRRAIARRILCVVAVLIIIFAAAELYLALRSYSSYSVSSSTERSDSAAVSFEAFHNQILKYTNDGAILMDGRNNLIWNQSYEMTTPTVAHSKNYLAIYDQNGIDIYIMTAEETVRHLEMSDSIQSVSVSDQGTVAVLMKSDDVAIVKLYDKTGAELANGQFYQENGGFPVDIALSYDAKKMAIAMVNVADGVMKSTITFYNFGSVGQNEIDNTVGEFEYEDLLIPEIEYVSNDKMIALSSREVMVFAGTEKPQLESEIELEESPRSVIYNQKYVAVSYAAESEGYHIVLYNFKGKDVMDVDTDLIYKDMYFLENGEICISDGNSVEIYTTHSIKKFNYVFDTEICRILSQGKGTEYVFIFDNSTQEVRLR